MRKLWNIAFTLVMLLVIVSVVYEALSQLSYRDYGKVVPTSIDRIERVDSQTLQNLLPNDVAEEIDTEGYTYYLIECTVENQSAVNSSFYASGAFGNMEGYYYSTLETVDSEREQGGSYQWYLPAGETAQVSFVILTYPEEMEIMAVENPDVSAMLPQE